MPRPRLEDVAGSWHQLIENFNTSSKDFYASVEGALAPRKIPGIKTSRVHWHEGGMLSPEREYLRVTGDEHVFDGFGRQYRPMEERLKALEDEVPRLQGELDFMKVQFLARDEVLAEAKDLHSRWPALSSSSHLTQPTSWDYELQHVRRIIDR